MIRKRVRSVDTEDKPVKKGLPPDVLESIQRVSKIHGANLVRKASDSVECNRIPTGCFMLDFALLGGYPQGYPTMIYGLESSGKSTATLKGVAEYQEKHPDKVVAFLDAEGLFDGDWAEKLGCNTDMMIVSSSETGEQGVDLIEEWIGVKSIGLIVLDSIPSMVPMNIIEKSAEDNTIAELARLMGKMCSKVIPAINRERRAGHWVTLWNINQFRNKVGLVFGSPLNLPGGRQINHIPSTKLWIKLKKEIEGKDANGVDIIDFNEHAFKFEKTKHGSSIKEGEFQFYLNPDNEKGLPAGSYDNVAGVMPFAKKYKFVTGGGKSWRLLTCKDHNKVFPNLDEMEKFLYGNEEELDTLMRSVIVHQRKSKGHTPLPPDGYLVSRIGRLVEID
jgi:recombination protein RecA